MTVYWAYINSILVRPMYHGFLLCKWRHY
jgi:hypothetical protein